MIKKTRLNIMLALLVVVLQGCFLNPIIGPGYSVSIYITDPNFKLEGMSQFEKIAVRENFEKVRTVDEADWHTAYFHYTTSIEEHRLTEIIISFGQKEKILEIAVHNIMTGQQVKNDIDRIATVYIDALSKIYGRENLRIERQRIGPGI